MSKKMNLYLQNYINKLYICICTSNRQRKEFKMSLQILNMFSKMVVILKLFKYPFIPNWQAKTQMNDLTKRPNTDKHMYFVKKNL